MPLALDTENFFNVSKSHRRRFLSWHQNTHLKGQWVTRFILLSFALFALPTFASNDSNISTEIRLVFQQKCKAHEFSGAIIVAKDGRILYRNACGEANKSFNVPNTLETKFNIASIGKLFTSVAIAKLVTEGKLSLATPVKTIVPFWVPRDEKKSLTVGQLLSHTSGLGNYMKDPRWRLRGSTGRFNSTDDYKYIIRDENLMFPPGFSQSYSNSAYMVLGAIIEKISGKSYIDYITDVIFKTAGMRSTGIQPLNLVTPNLAIGYSVDKEAKYHWRNNLFNAPFIGNAAGGAYTTASDLYRFSQALRKGPLSHFDLLNDNPVKPQEKLFTKNVSVEGVNVLETFSNNGFAGSWNPFGLAIWREPTLLGHTGGTQGSSNIFAMTNDESYTIIILSNVDNGGLLKLYRKLRTILGFKGKIKNI